MHVDHIYSSQQLFGVKTVIPILHLSKMRQNVQEGTSVTEVKRNNRASRLVNTPRCWEVGMPRELLETPSSHIHLSHLAIPEWNPL